MAIEGALPMKEGNARFSQVEFVNRVFLGDALEVMRRIPAEAWT